MDNQNFGKEVFTKSFDPELIHGWGKRTYNWEMGVSVQQELVPARRLHRRLLPPLVRQLLHRRQPHHRRRPTTRRSAFRFQSDPRLPGRRWRNGDRPTTSCRQGRPGGSLPPALLELRRDDRTLARHRRQRQRAAAQRLTVQGGTSTGAPSSRTTARSARFCRRPTAWDNTVAVQTTRA